MKLQTISLDGSWKITQLDNISDGGKVDIIGNVPGVVHYDMLSQGLVEDPYFRDNELAQQWIADTAWQYSRSFEVDADALACEKIILCCDGINTIADVFINDKHLAFVDNMHIAWRWDVREMLIAGSNTIKVVFKPLVTEMERRREDYWIDIRKGEISDWYTHSRQQVRQCQAYSGWDWGPAFAGPGLWRSVSLECYNGARMLNLTHQQAHSDGSVDITFSAFFDSDSAVGRNIEIEIGPIKKSFTIDALDADNRFKFRVTIDDPKLWWPAGYGEQPLYEVKAKFDNGHCQQYITQRIGLRSCELVQEKDEFGESFKFRVNGVDIFAKGNNWIPSDSFDCRLTDDQLRWELQSAVDANNNMLRLWGGGIYERDSFYEICDEIGMLIWHDFMFACHKYPIRPEFLASVEIEVRQNIRRIMNHPSVAMWCGNNECEQALGWGNLAEDARTYAVEYDKLFIQTIMPIVNAEDPARAYWPSSPTNGVRKFGDFDDPTRGDVHYWRVWHGNMPFSDYLTVVPRFCSEFGFQSFPSPELIDRYTYPEDRNITSRIMEHFQRSGSGNQKMLSHMSREFRVPVGWENTLYLSQVLQALSIKVACEHWRRIKPRNMGTLIWQLNDIWPGASWSSLDYEGRWKVMHYLEKKFFAPLLVSAVDKDGTIEIWATSDVNAPLTGTLTLKLQRFNGEVLHTEIIDVSLDNLESSLQSQFNFANYADEADRYDTVLRIELQTGEHYSENSVLFAPSKFLNLQKPDIKWSLSEDADGVITLDVSSDTFTPYLWLRHGQIHGVWSDNGMHLYANEPVQIKFKPRYEATLKQMQDELIVHDLYSSGF